MARHIKDCSCDVTRMIPFVDGRCRAERRWFGDPEVEFPPVPAPPDAELAAQRAEIKRMCEERDSAQACITKQTSELAALRERVAALEAGLKPFVEILVRVESHGAHEVDVQALRPGASVLRICNIEQHLHHARALLAPAQEPAHTCEIHRATSGASDCGLEPCEEAKVHRDLGPPRKVRVRKAEPAKCATCKGARIIYLHEWGCERSCRREECEHPCPACKGGGA